MFTDTEICVDIFVFSDISGKSSQELSRLASNTKYMGHRSHMHLESQE